MSTIRFGRLDPVLLLLPVIMVLIMSLASISMPGLMNPTQSGKFIFFSYAVLVLFSLFALGLPFRKQKRPINVTWIDILLTLYFVWITVNRYFLQPEHGFSMRYIELIGLAGVYLIIRQVDPRYIPWLLLAVIVSGVIQAIYGNMQLYGQAPSHNSNFVMTGSFFNPGPYAGFLASAFPVALGIFLFERKRMKVSPDSKGNLFARLRNVISQTDFRYYLFYLVAVAGLFTLMFVLPASRSRAAWIAVGVSSLFLVSIRYGFKLKLKAQLNTNLRKIFAVIVVFTLFGILGSGLYYFKKGSVDGRLLIWKVTLNMIADCPWTGYGFDRFKTHYMDYQAAYFKRDPDVKEAYFADNVYYAFNEPLQIFVENGIPGIVILGAIGIFIFVSRMPDNFLVTICRTGILSIFMFSLFSYPTQILPIKLNLVLFLAIVTAMGARQVFRIPISENRQVLAVMTIVVPFLFVGGIWLWNRVDVLKMDYKGWQSAYQVYQFRLYEEASKRYDKVKYLKDDGDFLMNYGKALSMAGDHENAIVTLMKAKKHLNTTIIETALGDSHKAIGESHQAEKCYFNAWYMAPGRFYPKYLLAKLYDETGKKEKALTTAQELITKEIKIQSVAIKEIRSEMEQIIEKYSVSRNSGAEHKPD